MEDKMRLIGLWGGVFAVMLGITTGFMGYGRQEALKSPYWAVFVDTTAQHLGDIYLDTPEVEGSINVTHSPQISEFVFNTSPDGKWMLVGAYDPANKYSSNIYLLASNMRQSRLLVENYSSIQYSFS